MRIYYQIRGGHVHMRVFFNGKMGDLVCAVDEFSLIQEAMSGFEFRRED